MNILRKHFIVIDSTNTWSKQHAHTFPHESLTVVTAEEQTAGRGRFNRHWESPPKQNVYATFNFFIEKHRNDIGNIPQILALSTAKMLEKLQFTPRFKWPNDLLLSEKKVGGILCETTPFSDTLCVILGIGLNVNMPLDLLERIDRPATSLLAESQQSYDLENIISLLIESFQNDLETFIDKGFYPFLPEYVSRLIHTKGSLIRFHDNRVLLEGIYESINTDGSLNLRMPSGEIRRFVSGEIL